MYGVAVSRELDAVHYLVGGDWGEENQPHTHHYRVEVRLFGENLDRFGYLVDISVLEKTMDELVGCFGGKTLNDIPEFDGLNPSIEHFCRIWLRRVLKDIDSGGLSSVTVRIWESETAWAMYAEEIG